jgi:hypothetical protein
MTAAGHDDGGIDLILGRAAVLRARYLAVFAVVVLAITASATGSISARQSAPQPPPPGQGKLIVYGDIALFLPPGNPDNCILRNRFKRGDPVGFRMFVADPSTGKREESAQLVVHVNVAGKTVDIPMRYRATAAQPEREFWVAKWVVPQDTPIGIIRFTVTATDKYGRTGEFKPFEVQASQVTIVE